MPQGTTEGTSATAIFSRTGTSRLFAKKSRYFLRLVSYIHLNPLRAGLAESLEDLERYPWSGHAVVMNRIRHEWQDRNYVLGYFGQRESSARKAYQEFFAEESGRGKQPELTGGGLIRSTGGWSEVKSLRKRQQKQFSDERILGSGEFVKEMLDDIEDAVKERLPAIASAEEAGERLRTACEEAGINVQALQAGSRRQECSELRKRLALEYVLELGMTYAGAARLLGISAAAVNRIVKRSVS